MSNPRGPYIRRGSMVRRVPFKQVATGYEKIVEEVRTFEVQRAMMPGCCNILAYGKMFTGPVRISGK